MPENMNFIINKYRRFTKSQKLDKAKSILFAMNQRHVNKEVRDAFLFTLAMTSSSLLEERDLATNLLNEKEGNFINEGADDTITALKELYKFYAITPIVAGDKMTITGSTNSSATAHAFLKQLPDKYKLLIEVKTLQGKHVDAKERTEGEAHSNQLKQMLTFYQGQPYIYHLTVQLEAHQIIKGL